MPFLPDILPCIVVGIFWRKVPRAPCPSRRPSVRPARSHSLPEERLLPGPLRHPSLPGVSRFRYFPLLPGPSTCPAWLSVASTSARCEPFPPNRLTPAPCGAGSWPGAMAAGAREQAASCDAFVLSRRLPAPDALPIRTSPAGLIAKAPSNLRRTTACCLWPGLPPELPSCSVMDPSARRRSGRGWHDRRGLAGWVGHEHTA